MYFIYLNTFYFIHFIYLNTFHSRRICRKEWGLYNKKVSEYYNFSNMESLNFAGSVRDVVAPERQFQSSLVLGMKESLQWCVR